VIPIGEKKLFLLDIDGTICVGNRLIPGADRFLNGLSEYGGDYVFITNNTTMSVADYRKKFAKLGIPTTSANFLTASVATAHYLKQKYGSRPVYVLGTDSLIRELESFGVCTTHDPEKEGIACVLASYDNELTYQKLTDICRLLIERPELDYAATNPDYACPIEFGYVPDCGSICEMIGHAVHRMPTYIGKPGTRMVEMALDMTGRTRDEAVLVGDRLYTDIACANMADISAALVLSGESTREEMQNSQYLVEYVYPSVKEMYADWVYGQKKKCS
jgi:HAD superfamily hydrolase (TIGR01450 family)